MKYVLFISALVVISVMLNSCKPEKTNEDKIIEFAVNDLRKRVIVPSSFILDSTKIGDKPGIDVFAPSGTPKLYRWKVEIYCQSQNRFGALLRSYNRYGIIQDSTGVLSVLTFDTYDNEDEYNLEIYNKLMNYNK